MKVRGRRRRSHGSAPPVQPVSFEQLFEAFRGFGAAATAAGRAMAATIAGLHLGIRRALELEAERARAYVTSERYELDRIARAHRGGYVAHLDAVAAFFAARAHRELDELLERLTGIHTVEVEIVPNTSAVRPAFRREQLGAWAVREAGC